MVSFSHVEVTASDTALIEQIYQMSKALAEDPRWTERWACTSAPHYLKSDIELMALAPARTLLAFFSDGTLRGFVTFVNDLEPDPALRVGYLMAGCTIPFGDGTGTHPDGQAFGAYQMQVIRDLVGPGKTLNAANPNPKSWSWYESLGVEVPNA